MFKNWSIKSLLQFSAATTIVFALLMVLLSNYGQRFIENNHALFTEQIQPLELSSRKIQSVALTMSTRMKSLMTLDELAPLEQQFEREAIEQAFEQNWLRIQSLLLDEDEYQALAMDLYQRFHDYLKLDTELHALKAKEIALNQQYQAMTETFDNAAEALHQEVDSLLEHHPRAELLAVLHEQLNTLILSTHTEMVLHTYQSQAHRHHLSLTHFQAELEPILVQLQDELNDSEFSQLTASLTEVEQVLFQDQGLFQLHIERHETQQLTAQKQYAAIDTMTQLNGDVNALLTFANQSAFDASVSQFSKAQYAHNVLLLLSVLMSVLIIGFALIIYALLEHPIEQLRKAFSSLSKGLLYTRLPASESSNELLLLSQDFNYFADKTEKLFEQVKESQLTTARKEEYLSAILNGVPEAILTLDEDGNVEATNPAAERVLAIEGDQVNDLHIHQLLHESLHFEDMVQLANYAAEHEEDIQAYRLNGEPIYVRLSFNKLDSDEHPHWVCVIADVTQWRYADAQFKQLTVELNAILENAIIGIAYVSDRKFLRVNRRFETLFGYERDEVIQQSTNILYINHNAFELIGKQAYDTMATGESFGAQVEMVKQDGSQFWCAVSGNAINPEKPHEGSIWLFEDVTLQRENEEYLIQLASLDPLTGLINRTVFNDRIAHAIHKSARQAGQVAVCFIDLDHFKHVNDSMGHKAGDALLKQVAERLKLSLREGDSVARLGGDEFALLLEDVSSVKDVAKIADKVLLAMAQPYEIEGKEVSVSPSIGISLYPSDGRDGDMLIRNADAAMYHAKKTGRNNFQFYSAEMTTEATERVELESDLRRAIKLEEFILHFQPQYDVATGQISGAEVLIRWQSDTRGLVPPNKFIPILEDTGMIIEVGEWVLRESSRFFVSIQDKVPADFKMAVNLSSRQFKGGQLISSIDRVLKDTAMPTANLELEITESLLMDDPALATLMLSEIADLGIQLAIDDFGTGYSSLSYLKQFPLNVLKIDRSFIRDLMSDEDDAAIVDAIMAMSTKLGLDVVAEGVETEEQLNYLAKIGCHRAQGFHLSRPLPQEDFLALLEK